MPDKKFWPKISIVTPSYNQGQFIEEAIRSVLLQGYPDLEYIIIDGGSTDQTVEIIKKYEPWLAYWESEPDKGQSHAINKGLAKSTGKLFNWHNSDDILMPNCLGLLAEAMVKYPQASYIHGDRIYIDDKGNLRDDKKYGNGDRISFSPKLSVAISVLQAGSQPGCLMDRELVVTTGMMDENLCYIMDADIFLKIALIRPPIYINRPLSYVRVYPGIKSLQWNPQRAKERIVIAQKIFNRQHLSRPVRKLRRKSFATAYRFAWQCYVQAKMYRAALQYLLLDVFHSPAAGWGKRWAICKSLIFGK